MRIGYACINNTLGLSTGKTFRLHTFSNQKLQQTIRENLDALKNILMFNAEKGLLNFRIHSLFIPFASHEICNYDWVSEFQNDLLDIGKIVLRHKMRISMHPDAFLVINSPNTRTYHSSVKELTYHAQLLDAMGLDKDAKIQIHLGGVYGNKKDALTVFIKRYKKLSDEIKKRLVIENDDFRYSVKDCLGVHQSIGIPIVFDNLHHECLNHHEPAIEAFKKCARTWQKKDGPPMMDYSDQEPGHKTGRHGNHINIKAFKNFITQIDNDDLDIILEIKDKEKSALQAHHFIEKYNNETIGVLA